MVIYEWKIDLQLLRLIAEPISLSLVGYQHLFKFTSVTREITRQGTRVDSTDYFKMKIAEQSEQINRWWSANYLSNKNKNGLRAFFPKSVQRNLLEEAKASSKQFFIEF